MSLKRLALAALFPLLAAMPGFAHGQSATAEQNAAIEQFKLAQAAASAQKNGDTIAILSQLIAANSLPADWQPMAHFLRGQAFRRENKFNEAYKDFDAAIKLKPTMHQAMFESGLGYVSQEQWKKAIKEFDRAIKLDAKNADYLYSRCSAKSWAGDNAGARDDCREAVKQRPKFVQALATLGRAYEDLGQLDKAVETYKEVLKIDPENKSAKEGIAFIEEKKRIESGG